jgi:hypothetical protein
VVFEPPSPARDLRPLSRREARGGRAPAGAGRRARPRRAPPYLADRDEQLQRFRGYLRNFPAKHRNIRLSGLRGVGKTVLLKEYRAAPLDRDWVIVRRDLTARL